MVIKKTIFKLTALLCIAFAVSSANQKKEASKEYTTENIHGKVLFKGKGQTYKGTTFFVDSSTPRSEWLTNNAVGMETETPIFAATFTAIKPHDISVGIGYSGKKVNNKKLSGTLSLDATAKNPFTITVILDKHMKSFTFSSGVVTIQEITPQKIKLKAKGKGLYSDIKKQEYLDNQPATIEIELTFPNIIIDGKDVKKVKN